MTEPKQASLPYLQLKLDDVLKEEEGLLLEIIASPKLSVKEMCDVVGRFCKSAKYCDDDNLWRMIEERMGIHTFRLAGDSILTAKQNVQRWCTFLHTSTPADVFAFIRKVFDQQPPPPFINDEHLWELLLEALGVKDYTHHISSEFTKNREKVWYWWLLFQGDERWFKVMAIYNFLEERDRKASYGAIKWIFDNVFPSKGNLHLTREELIEIFRSAMEEGDIRIVKLVMDKVREFFGQEYFWTRHFVDYVVYDALSNFLNTRSGSTEIWRYVQSLSPSGYATAFAKAHLMNNLDAMKYIVENDLIPNGPLVRMYLRDFLHTTEEEVNKDPENPRHRAMLEWLREQLNK